MISALLNGIVGLSLSILVGTQALNLTLVDSLRCVLSSNIAGLFALLTTLQAERFLKPWLNRSLKTWALLLILYLGGLIATAPVLRDSKTLVYLLFPLILSTGFSILVFGPIQDRLVRRQQRKAHAQATRNMAKKSKTKNDFPCFPTDSAVL